VEIRSEIKEKMQTEEGKSFATLLRITFESAKEPLEKINKRDIKVNEFERFSIDVKEKLEGLLNAFSNASVKSSEWYSTYLPDHPSIRRYISG
jgi:hypothetical protein